EGQDLGHSGGAPARLLPDAHRRADHVVEGRPPAQRGQLGTGDARGPGVLCHGYRLPVRRTFVVPVSALLTGPSPRTMSSATDSRASRFSVMMVSRPPLAFGCSRICGVASV